jgi:hypothetical protein
MKIFLWIFILSVLFGCGYSSSQKSSIETNLNTCLGENATQLLEELVISYEDFLIDNNYAKSHKDLTSGISKYLEDVANGEFRVELKHDIKTNTEIYNKLITTGFIHDSIYIAEKSKLHSLNKSNFPKQRRVADLDGWPYFDPYAIYLPCLDKSINDTTSLFYYYVDQKYNVGSLAPNIFSWNILGHAKKEDYESDILKEIIIFEVYVGLIIENSD